MARRKNTVEEIDVAQFENTESVGSTKPDPEQSLKEEDGMQNEAIEKPKANTNKNVKKTSIQDIPESALGTLKIFSNYPELLITQQGCVYTPDCKLDAAKAAILYKNPFFNN